MSGKYYSKKSPKILFITNKRSLPYTDNSSYSNSIDSGLSNSIKFVVNMLMDQGFDAKYKQVIDANGINKELHKLKPNIVILEAIWVSPAKLEELAKIHPAIKWVIRIHSEIPFLANEGVAMAWMFEYMKINNVQISANSTRAAKELNFLFSAQVPYLPNYYHLKKEHKKIESSEKKPRKYIDICCFGAIRPMKNQLMQAICAMMFAERLGKKVRFHININREETGGNQVLKNIRSLFENMEKKEHKLVEHKWAGHDEFMKVIATMDFGMQISFSETFNLTTADMVACQIPIVISKEVNWLDSEIAAEPVYSNMIVNKMIEIWRKQDEIVEANLLELNVHNRSSIRTWINFINSQTV